MARPLVLPEIAKSTAKVLKNNDIAIFKLRNLKVVALKLSLNYHQLSPLHKIKIIIAMKL